MNIDTMSNEGAIQTLNEICDGMKRYFVDNPESIKYYLGQLIENFLDPLAQDDGFGTEGWEHAFGIED